MKKSSQDIAIAGVTTSISFIFLVLGIYVNQLTISMNILAGVCLFIPLSRSSLSTAFLSYVAVCLLGLIFTFVKSALFTLLFGFYPLLKYVLENKLRPLIVKDTQNIAKKVIVEIFLYIIKLLYYNLVLYGLFVILKVALTDIKLFDINWAYWSFALLFSAAFIVYDTLLTYLYKLVERLVKRYFPKRDSDEIK